MIEIFMKKSGHVLVPADQFSADQMEELDDDAIYRIKLTKRQGETYTDEQRSIAQNKLYWGWLSDMSRTKENEFAGFDKEDWHTEMKRRFLIYIYEASPDKLGYSTMLYNLRQVYKEGMKAESAELMEFIIKETTTTDASIPEFMEYLGNIEHYCHMRGIVLRTDEYLYAMAMENNP